MFAKSITDGFPVSKELLIWAQNAPITTLPQVFEHSYSEWPDRPYVGVREGREYKFFTYAEIRQQIMFMASALVELDFKKEDRVANFCNNRPEWPVIDFGTCYAACIHTPMYPTLSQKEMAFIVRNSEARIIFVGSKGNYTKVLASLENCPGIEHVVVLDDYEIKEGDLPENCRKHVKLWKWADLIQFGSDHLARNFDKIQKRMNGVKAEDVCSFVYTSGTTGDPKGVMLAHGNFTYQATALAPLVYFTPDDVQLSFLPLSHVFERIVYYAMTTYGGKIGYARGIQSVVQDLQLLHPTIVPSVPRLFEKVFARVLEQLGHGLKDKVFRRALKVGRAYREAKSCGKVPAILRAEHAVFDRTVFKKVRESMGGCVRFFISGGAPLRADVANFFQDVGLTILEGYGLTETSPVITVNRPEHIRVGTVGESVPGVTLRIAEDGEIVMRGINLMRGYFRRLADTKEAIDADGWFHTGDIGYLDEEGCLVITDRKKEIIVLSNGKNVAPQPIENAINASEWIAQTALIGNNRNHIVALIVPDFLKLENWAKENKIEASREELVARDDVNSLLMAEVREACSKISNYEKVRKIAVLSREFLASEGEVTPTLKLKRRIIDAHFRSVIEALYANFTVEGMPGEGENAAANVPSGAKEG